MITQALQSNGAKVYITGRRENVLKTTAEKYSTGPGSVHPLPGDISSKEEVIRLAKELESKEPEGIQLLVNNAGIARDDNTKFSTNGQPDMTDAAAISKHFLKTEEQQWADTMRTNVAAQYYMSLAFLPLLAKGGSKTEGYSSQIVNVSSISGALKGSSCGQPIYATSKAAYTHLSRMLATTFQKIPVRVNVIAPGLFPSEMTAGSSDEDNKSVLDMTPSNPARRTGQDSDMAATILFLAGKSGLFYNGQILSPDGGLWLDVLPEKSDVDIVLTMLLRLNSGQSSRDQLGKTPGLNTVITLERILLFEKKPRWTAYRLKKMQWGSTWLRRPTN